MAAKKADGKPKLKPSRGVLNAQQARFCREYIIDGIGSYAAIRAGYSARSSKEIARVLLSRPHVQAEVLRLTKAQAKRLEMSADSVLELLWGTASADPNEIDGIQIGCCRYCHGKDHRYQQTPAELERSRESWQIELTKLLESEKEEDQIKAQAYPAFDERGGVGYNPNNEPNPTCPECFGEGVQRPFLRDTRKLGKAAKALYAGIKITKDGVEIKKNSQDAARMAIAKHFGLMMDRTQISYDLSNLTDEDLEALERIHTKIKPGQ